MDHGDEWGSGVEAEGPVRDEADLVVHTFEAGVGETGRDEGEDARQMPAYGAGEADEGWEARALSPGEPGQEGSSCVERAAVGEDVEEGLLQEIGPVEWDVARSDGLQLRLFAGVQVLGVLEERPAGLLDGPPVFGIELARLGSADLGDGVLGESDDVEAVEDDGWHGGASAGPL